VITSVELVQPTAAGTALLINFFAPPLALPRLFPLQRILDGSSDAGSGPPTPPGSPRAAGAAPDVPPGSPGSEREDEATTANSRPLDMADLVLIAGYLQAGKVRRVARWKERRTGTSIA